MRRSGIRRRSYDEENFFGNLENHWTPRNIVSLMILAVPEEKAISVQGLNRIEDPQEWWAL